MTDWLDIARYDWVQVNDRVTLHAVGVLANEDDVDTDWHGQGFTLCGIEGTLWIPGVLNRMARRRCVECCDKLGMPRGKGSPKNDEACRVILGLPTSAACSTEDSHG